MELPSALIRAAPRPRGTRQSGSALTSSQIASPEQPTGRNDVSGISRMAAGQQAHRAHAPASSKCREPTSAMAVNEPGLGSSADGKGEEGIDRSFERAGTPLHLGEEKSSLERGEQSSGEVVRVDVGRELPVGM